MTQRTTEGGEMPKRLHVAITLRHLRCGVIEQLGRYEVLFNNNPMQDFPGRGTSTLFAKLSSGTLNRGVDH